MYAVQSNSFFKTLIDHEVTVELKNDIQLKGKLKSVDQYLNIKLDEIQVVEELKYPHLVCETVYQLSPLSSLTPRCRALLRTSSFVDLSFDMSTCQRLRSIPSCWRMLHGEASYFFKSAEMIFCIG
jgi:small nuclear ribonucleoprotein (snRNP)-like protein